VFETLTRRIRRARSKPAVDFPPLVQRPRDLVGA
jgi:hypothetical protein